MTTVSPRSAADTTDLPRLLRFIFFVRRFINCSSYEDIRSGRRNFPKLSCGYLMVTMILVFLCWMAYQLNSLEKTIQQINNKTVLYVSNLIQLVVISIYPTLFFIADLYFSPVMNQIFSELEGKLDIQSHKGLKNVRNVMFVYVLAVLNGQIFRWYYFGSQIFIFAMLVCIVCLAYAYVFFTYAYYISIVTIVKNELRSINKTIKAYLNQEDYHAISKEDIYRLDKKYNTLYNITLQLNETYSILVVVGFLMDTMGIATGVFKVSQNFMESYISSSAPHITPLFMHELEWWFNHICFLLWTIDTCVSTQQKAYKSTLLAHKLHLHNTNTDLTSATGTFRRHLKLQEMKFTGCDMFEINYETMLTILSTMGTYGIILIQFQIQIASDQ